MGLAYLPIYIYIYKVGPYDRYKWSYNPYKWPYNWVTGVITPISGVITLLITGRGAHLVHTYKISCPGEPAPFVFFESKFCYL